YMRQYDLDKKIRFLVNQCISCHATWLNAIQAPLVAIAFIEKTTDDENFKATIETLYKALAAKRGVKPRSLDEIIAPFIVFTGMLPVIPRGDNILTKKPPIATRTILIACIAIFLADMLFSFSGLLFLSAHETIQEFQWYRLITYSFLHANIFHLAGNMLFLWAFARGVEDELGWEKFTALYAISAVFSGILFLATPSGKNLPCVGASGAISGVIGAHLILFPKAKIIFDVYGLSKKITTAVSSFYYIAFWIGMNIWFGVAQLAKDSSRVAFWGHIGGFMAGVVFIEVYKNFRRQ
ncbi:MAG: rhomboid family intramembrane serine protease, partial [Candidatus Omnitrophica bacterium]|nr:rhomboid family intramembrane serine protease [Candidatus Omnitrophota bacterium]